MTFEKMQNHQVDHAYRFFSSIVKKSNPTYAAMMKGLITNRLPEKALDLFDEMIIEPDDVTFVVLLNACAKTGNDRAIKVGKKLVQQISTQYQNSIFVLNSAIYMLMKFGDIQSAESIFNLIKNKDNYTYGVMMKGYAENKKFDKILDLYEQMNLKPDHIIYIIVLNACVQDSHDRAKHIGKTILQQIPNICPDKNVLLTSGLNMLMNIGDVSAAERLFRAIRKRDVIAYGAIMHGYRINDQPLKCFESFEELKQDNLVPDEIIFNILFGACSEIGILSKCKSYYNQMPSHFQSQQRIQNALIHMWVSDINFNY
ncbi:unnamed protein product [Rotaria magnacalcarata]|uniref:Pentatricopeptide repeat-containing protein n=1 Tax=Rotaria magnacalcarata TaxID=392030 RepID=A0A8S2KHF1_9BILA|nr:unnamed protein product [Rotaria magnacalcarata]CAF3871674.1 unnamed protein product [Rotaria magnacalcarata]